MMVTVYSYEAIYRFETRSHSNGPEHVLQHWPQTRPTPWVPSADSLEVVDHANVLGPPISIPLLI